MVAFLQTIECYFHVVVQMNRSYLDKFNVFALKFKFCKLLPLPCPRLHGSQKYRDTI